MISPDQFFVCLFGLSVRFWFFVFVDWLAFSGLVWFEICMERDIGCGIDKDLDEAYLQIISKMICLALFVGNR